MKFAHSCIVRNDFADPIEELALPQMQLHFWSDFSSFD